MYKQQNITQRQVEGLIGGTLEAYNGLLLLDGNHFSHAYQAGNFTGASKVTVNNAGKLDKIVDNLIGLTLKSTIPSREVYVQSDIFNENVSAEDIERLKNTYNDQLNSAETFVQEVITNERTRKNGMIDHFNDVMTQLRESYKTNDVQEIADAVERVSDATTWGTLVHVKPLYEAAGALKEMAAFNMKLGFDARGIYGGLQDTMYDARVKEKHSFLGLPYSVLAEPNELQVYKGDLDYELIAQDLMRLK